MIEKQFKDDNDQNRIKDDLQELVDHIAINFLLKPFEFRKDFIESIIIQTNHLRKNYKYEIDHQKKIEVITALVLSGLVFKEYQENYEFSLIELEKLINTFFDDGGFPLSRSPHDLLYFAKYFLLIKEVIKEAQKYVPDTLEGLIDHSSELRWLSVYGGGVGGHWSDLRTVSDIAPGPIPFLHTVDADMIAYRQGKTRKGSSAAYMSVHPPDIVEFLNIRIPTGDVQRKALNLHNAINIPDEFMEAVINDEDYELRDPKDDKVK